MSILGNLNDVVQSIQTGKNRPVQAMIGDLLIDAVTDLSTPQNADVTSRPVQAGYSVSLGHIKQPDSISMTIILTDPAIGIDSLVDAAFSGSLSNPAETWVEKRDRLYAMFASKEIVSVVTHSRLFDGFVIKGIDDVYNNQEDLDAYVGTVDMVQWGDSQDIERALDDAATASKAFVGGM